MTEEQRKRKNERDRERRAKIKAEKEAAHRKELEELDRALEPFARKLEAMAMQQKAPFPVASAQNASLEPDPDLDRQAPPEELQGACNALMRQAKPERELTPFELLKRRRERYS